VYTLGPYQIDAQRRRLMHNGDTVPIPDRQFDILLHLAAHAGTIVPKDALVQVAWKDVAVTDNSLEQAISSLRRTLGTPQGGGQYIETVPRRGYRLGVGVTVTADRHSDAELAATLAPYRAFVEGRAALETLDRDAVARACAVFDRITQASPDDAAAHLGLANALALSVEATRAAGHRDERLLARALHHASEACRLDPSGEAWAALGLVCHQTRDRERAVAALRHAVAIDPDNWRHHLRLAYVSWGEERLRAAHRVLSLLPGFPFAHWLAATVHVARQALPTAERELVAGAAGQDRQRESSPFQAVGLHLLFGLVRLACGDEEAALTAFDRELSFRSKGSIYAREASANTWCAIGAIRLRRFEQDLALAAFDQATALLPGYPTAIAARAAVVGTRAYLDDLLGTLREQGDIVEAALAEAAYEAVAGRSPRAADLMLTTLEGASAGSSAWDLPVNPFLHVSAHAHDWDAVLTLLRSRAA